MKTQEAKYTEACERNVKGAETYNRKKYVGKSIEDIKRSLGIRQSDTTYDNRLHKVSEQK